MMESKRSNTGNSSRSRTNSNDNFIRSGSYGSDNGTTINNLQQELGQRTNSNHFEQIYENVKTDNTLL